VTVSWTTTTLLAAVRREAQVPDSGSSTAFGHTDQEILDIATNEIQTRIVPFLRSCRENYLLRSTTQTLTVDTSDYRIPSDSQAAGIHSVIYLDANSLEHKLVQRPIQDDVGYVDSGVPRAFAVLDDKIRLFPTPDTANTIRILYYRRASALVPVASCYPVASKTSSTIVVTGTPDSTFNGTGIDVVQAKPHFSVLLDNNAATLSTSTFTVVSSASTADVAVGDYVALHMETCIPGVPAELWHALVTCVGARLLDEEGDAGGFARKMALAEATMQRARAILSPRVDGAPRFVVTRNSPLRGAARRGGRTWDTT
jgi:hypothetical protein